MESKETIERIYITRQDFVRTENEIRFQEHLRRYASIRRFCYGKVLDFACGCGYGTYILSVNPEVASIVGLDIDANAVAWAKTHFDSPKARYVLGNCKDLHESFDTLVCLETIEHIQDINDLKDLVSRCNFDTLILSFPDKKSTHFNAFHYHDFVLQDMLDLFPSYLLFHSFKLIDVQFVLFSKKPENAPAHIFRNLQDL